MGLVFFSGKIISKNLRPPKVAQGFLDRFGRRLSWSVSLFGHSYALGSRLGREIVTYRKTMRWSVLLIIIIVIIIIITPRPPLIRR